MKRTKFTENQILAGISSKAATTLGNKFKYNGKEEQRKEFSDGSGLEWLDYGARMYDNQIGRFFTQDRFSEQYMGLTPYQYTSNSPVNYIDYNGDYILIFGQQGGHDFSVMYENGKAYYYTMGKNGTVTRGEEYKGDNAFITQAVSDFNSIADTEKGKKRIGDLQNSTYRYDVREAQQLAGFSDKASHFSPSSKEGGGTIFYYQKGGMIDGVSFKNSSFALGHELQHAWDLEFTNAFFNKNGERTMNSAWKLPQSEVNAVAFGNYLRAKAGEKEMRQYYSANPLFHGFVREYFLKTPDPLKKNEQWFVPRIKNAPGADNTKMVRYMQPVLIDSRTKQIVTQ